VNHLSSFFSDSRGARLRYQYWEDTSKGYDRIALLLHGLGCHSGSYPSLVPAFVAARYKVVAMDFAGFGESPGERGAGGALAMADDVETLVRRIESAEGAREIEIIAHSLGAIAAFLFLKRYPARRSRVAAVAPLLYGVPVDVAPETLAEDEALRARFAADPRFASSIPASLAGDLDSAAKGLLADPSFMEGRKAGFFVGESDDLVPFERLKETVAGLPLASSSFVSFPRERHEITGGKYGDQAIAAIRAWFDETRFEQRQ
jgi:alpha-beta hydrolase superfamily lysophospholipase